MSEVSFVHIDEVLYLFWGIFSSFSSLGLLVGLVNDKALQNGIHSDAVDSHEEHSDSV